MVLQWSSQRRLEIRSLLITAVSAGRLWHFNKCADYHHDVQESDGRMGSLRLKETHCVGEQGTANENVVVDYYVRDRR